MKWLTILLLICLAGTSFAGEWYRQSEYPDPSGHPKIAPVDEIEFNWPPPRQIGEADYFAVARDGKAACSIVIPANPSNWEDKSAAMLKTYLDLVTGGSFEIKRESASGGPAIYIGGTEIANKVPLDLPPIKYPGLTLPNLFGFEVKTVDGRRFEDCRTSLELLAQSAREAGVILAVENMPSTYLAATPEETRSLIDGLDPKAVGFCLDTGHAMLGNGGIGDYFEALGDRIVAIQWHDNDGKDDKHLYPGAGKNSWQEFFAGLARFDIDLPVTVEAAPPDGIPLQAAIKEVQQALLESRTPRLRP